MRVEVTIASVFRSYFDGRQCVRADGDTVGQCLKYLSERYPMTKKMFFDDDGNIQNHFEVFLNGQSTYHSGYATPVCNGDKIDLVYIIHGG